MKGQPFALSSISLQDDYWLAWQRAFLETGIKHQWEQCESTGRLQNFRRVSRGETTGHQGYYYNDSDIYKLLEAASYALHCNPDWDGRAKVDEVVGLIESAQMQDGYIDTAFQLGPVAKRWKGTAAKHEMYCMGHLIEAAVAHHHATGSGQLLAVGERAAQHVASVFGPDKRVGFCGHQEFELALCRLSDTVQNPSYRDLARWMIESRGRRPSPFEAEFTDPDGKELNANYVPLVFKDGKYDGAYYQDDRPLKDQTEAVGHAVRAMYMFCGAVDSSRDPGVAKALTTIWTNLVHKRIYVTGGIGSAGRNEGFTMDYDLPNREAYAETCAAIGLVFWAARMSRATGDPRYAHWMERSLYNAVMSGVNMATDRYFYVNPLESRGDHLREPWYGCACCPPNIARLVMSVQSYAAYETADGITVDLPISADYRLASGASVSVRSEYPWSGSVEVRVAGGSPTIRLRIPDWAAGATAKVGGTSVECPVGGYLQSKANDVTIELPMAATWVGCDERVPDNLGKVALTRGPIVYCLEEVDLGSPVHLFSPGTSQAASAEVSNDPRDKVNLLVNGSLAIPSDNDQLYGPPTHRRARPMSARYVSYASWANRTPGSMAVWLRPE